EIISKPDNLAYIIYTSGTTGQPKGVMIENRSVANIYESWKKEYQLEKIEINLLQLASISFDVFVGDICRSILNGGKMVICPNNVKLDYQSLYELLKKHKISILEGTPSLLLGLCDLIITKKLDFSFLKIFIFGSDSFNNQDFLSIRNKFGNSIKVINSYGVTEVTIDSTYFDDALIKFRGTTPIGKPFSNTQIYIGNKNRLAPIGVYDRLHISGSGLSRGYLNKPELTAEKFIVNPFVEGTKMYDTGDLARWLPDGNIEFLGRADFQVKIRGYRIELGEIETSLSQFSQDIAQVVVEAKEINSEKVLVAYYTTRENKEIDKTNLREYLQSKLPEYMVPSYFVELETIPLTPNGKIDRKGLPSVSGEDLIRREYIAPRNATEEQLVTIWQEVLGVENIGITDSFFELGGHSLMAAQVLNKMHQRLSLQISFKDFFATPTIEGISKNLIHKNYVAIPKAAEQESYPLTPSQQRLWVLSQLEGGSQAYNMPAVVRLKGELDIINFEKAFQELIARHEILRTCFRSDKATGEIRQHIKTKEDLTFNLTVLDFQNIDSVAIENYLEQTNAEAFDLEQGPLLRASLLQKGSSEYVFFLSMHHIIGDGWSTELLISEVV
ncbi:condensation domain-containing protein, partial [Flavobacterium oreochromis]|uniref:condensation domain-containing protein n=1 Tax=Flavobacterium oreochromis TaxID=2906078 RepID=UPI00385DC9FB